MSTRDSQPQSVSRLLRSGNSGLANLIAGAKARMELTQQVTKYLPMAMHDHCWVTALDEGQLTVVTDSPVWASKLRYLSRDLISKLRQEKSLPAVSFINIKVAPDPLRAVTPGER